MNKSDFQAELVAISEQGERDRILGAIMGGDDRTPLGSSMWRRVVLPLLQGDPGSSQLDSVPADKHNAILVAWKGWVKAISKPGPAGAMSSDTAALASAAEGFSVLDQFVGSKTPAKTKAPSKPRVSAPKAPAKTKAPSKPRVSAPKAPAKTKAPSKPRVSAPKAAPLSKGSYRVRFDLTFEEI